MSTAERTAAGADQSRSYGAALHTVYDNMFPAGPAAERTAEQLLALVGGGTPVVVELGVGTGRVALPVAARGARVTGVDSSPELLAVAAARAQRDGVALRLVTADIRDWVPDVRADLVACVCATLSMLLTADEQRRALAVAARALAPGGVLVVETHNPDPVRHMHTGRPVVSLDLPVVDVPGGVRTTSRLADDATTWHLEHRWHDGRAPRSGEEHARLLPPEELADLAAAVGLRVVRVLADFSGAPADPASPTYVAVLSHDGGRDPRPPADPVTQEDP